jgi:hypothetical protein
MVHLKSHEVAARQLVAAHKTCVIADATGSPSLLLGALVAPLAVLIGPAALLPSNVTTINAWFWLPGVLKRLAGLGKIQLFVSCTPTAHMPSCGAQKPAGDGVHIAF